MKLLQPHQNPSNQFQPPITGILTLQDAATKQYLETARGHYITAVAAPIPQNQQLPHLSAILHAPHFTCHQLAQPHHPHPHPNTVFEMQFPKSLSNGPAKQLQPVNLHLHFNPSLSTTNTPQLPEMVHTLGVFGEQRLRLDAPHLEAAITVSSDFADAEESSPKGMLESSSLQKTVDSLKADLQNLKREHAELKINDAVVESLLSNCKLIPSHCNPKNEGYLAEEAKYRHAYEQVDQNKNETDSLKIKSKGRKREHCSLKSYSEVDKRPRVTPYISDGNGCRMSALDASKSVPERMYFTCVSTSESSARIMNSKDELQSSSQQPEGSNSLESENLMVIEARIEADKCDRVPEFSIRDYVFSARNKDINTNWPFSKKNLQLCLKHGVKNVLPPFQPLDSFRDSSVRRCLVEKSISSEESYLNERPSVMKIHPVRGGTAINRCWNQEFAEGFRDLDSFPSVQEKDLAFQTTSVICQSEVGSVSTSNLPLSDVVSDEHEAAASAANKTKSSVSHVFDKKRGSALKLTVNSRRATPEDITSACTAPSEATATKICPVCENFSSSSNTTLNAHIDQCLSSQSSPNWMKNSKLVNPRIKPRKMRSMVDICATAPRCTLEDLDRRNGSNWAINLDTTSEDTGLHIEGTNQRVSSRYTVNNRDDDSVYIDSCGRKIRILSKFNETVLSSFPKPRKDAKVRKQSKRGKRSNLFFASRKRRLVKHLKYLRFTRHKKHLLSLKVKERSAKACAAEEATCAGHESRMKHQPLGSLGKGLEVQEQKNQIVPETSGRTSSLAKKNDPETTTAVCRYDLRMRNDHTVTGRKLAKKLSHFPKKTLCSMQRSMRAEHKSSGSSGKTMRSPPLKNKIQDNEQTILVPLKFRAPGFNGKSTKDRMWKSLDSGSTPVPLPEKEIKIQSDAVPNTGSCKILRSCRTNPFEAMRSCNSETDARSTDTREQTGAKQGCSQGGLRDTNSFSECAGGTQCNYGFAGSAERRHGGKEIDDPVLSTSLAIEETDISLNPSFDPELQKVADVSPLLSGTMQCTNKFQSPLSQDESKGYLPQHDPMEEQMLYRGVSATERSELKMGSGNFNLVEIDPILIPGPPGSDLPSFSDMGSEDLQTSSSSLEHSFGDGDNVVNGDSSDSLFSAASSIFNLGVPNDHVYQGWLSASSPMDTLTVFSQSTAVKTERGAFIVNDLKEGEGRGQQCCCSRKEAIPWSAAMNIQESELLGQRMSSLVAFPGEKYRYSSLTKWPYGQDNTICRSIESEKLVNSGHTSHQNITSVQSPRFGDSDSSTPAPILRLMGKDLMVVNNEEDDPSLVPAAQNVNPISETSSKHDITWEHHSSQSPALIGPQPYVHDITFSVKCFDDGPSNMINSFGSPNSTSDDMYINDHVHPSLGIRGTAPVKR